jgi:hypothetical protein
MVAEPHASSARNARTVPRSTAVPRRPRLLVLARNKCNNSCFACLSPFYKNQVKKSFILKIGCGQARWGQGRAGQVRSGPCWRGGMGWVGLFNVCNVQLCSFIITIMTDSLKIILLNIMKGMQEECKVDL